MEQITKTRRMQSIESLQTACVALATNIVAERDSTDDDVAELSDMLLILVAMRNR